MNLVTQIIVLKKNITVYIKIEYYKIFCSSVINKKRGKLYWYFLYEINKNNITIKSFCGRG